MDLNIQLYGWKNSLPLKNEQAEEANEVRKNNPRGFILSRT
jgi:hypothetical protein